MVGQTFVASTRVELPQNKAILITIRGTASRANSDTETIVNQALTLTAKEVEHYIGKLSAASIKKSLDTTITEGQASGVRFEIVVDCNAP